MRRIVSFSCEGVDLFGTLDAAPGATGVLIVSGGNEIRCGAHRGMAALAARLAAAGVPVFRFDRRGVGDSAGENRGYAASGPDIAAALATFRREQPQLARVVGFGNCDAATALALLDPACDALVLANPWLGDDAAPLPPAALRTHYRHRLTNRAAWQSLLTGNLPSKLKDLCGVLAKPRQQPLTTRIATALTHRPTTIVLASGDRTAQVFAAAIAIPAGMPLVRIDTASHSFAGRGEALAAAILAAVAAVDDDRDV